MDIYRTLGHICGSFENHYTRKNRLNYSRKALKRKLQTVQTKTMSKQQHEDIELVWRKYFNIGKLEYKWFEFYHTLRPDDRVEQFIPNNLFYAYIDTYFNDYRASQAYDDKNMYELFFPDILQPETVIHGMGGGRLLNDKYLHMSLSSAIEKCKDAHAVIIKPAIGTDGGKGIVFWQESDNIETLKKSLSAKHPFVVQKLVKQHEVLSRIHQSSINTIRIMTLCWNDKVKPLSAVLRMGVNGSKVDNVSAGGIACGINWDGSLKEKAYSARGEFFFQHPQGAVFRDFTIPGFDKCVELVKCLAPRMSRISKMISWDLAINESGNPVLIEANFSYGQLDFHQMCNGPLFGEMTEDVLKRVFSKKKIFKW